MGAACDSPAQCKLVSPQAWGQRLRAGPRQGKEPTEVVGTATGVARRGEVCRPSCRPEGQAGRTEDWRAWEAGGRLWIVRRRVSELAGVEK
jgi:hypothetical protein